MPPYAADSMMACSRKLFNASQDGDVDYALAVMKTTIETLSMTIAYLSTQEGSNNGTH
jgi:hypothetical protein